MTAQDAALGAHLANPVVGTYLEKHAELGEDFKVVRVTICTMALTEQSCWLLSLTLSTVSRRAGNLRHAVRGDGRDDRGPSFPSQDLEDDARLQPGV